jgi:hypothetical protein
LAEEQSGRVRGWFKGLDNYWFGRESPTAMGLFRIIMSSLIFVNLVMILTDFDAWFSEHGFVPQRIGKAYLPNVDLSVWGRFHFSLPIVGDSLPRINVLSGVTDDRITLAVYLTVMIAALLCAFGLWTRLTSIVMAIGVVSLQHRNGIILHGGDSVIRISALYIALAPSGASCSLDRLIGLWKGRIKPGPVRVSAWVQRVLAYNTALIYFTTFWHKFGFGSHWRDMTATWYPARLHEFDRFPVPGFVNQLPIVYFTTFATLAIELSLGTLVFYRPLRKWVLLGGIGMHAFIDYSMNIPLFSYLMVALYISFYDGSEIDGWARRVGVRLARWRATVFFPQGMQLKPTSDAMLEAADPFGLVSYEEGMAPTWQATSKGKPANPYRISWSRSVGAWIIGPIPTLWRRLLMRSIESVPLPTGVKGPPSGAKVNT